MKVHHSVISDEISKGVQTTGRWICGVCGISVARNSIQYTKCRKWVHKQCSGVI